MYQNIYLEKLEKWGATVHLWDDENGYLSFPYNDFRYGYREDPDGALRSLYGTPVSQTHRWTHNDPFVIETDLPRETRVLTDLYLDSDEPAKGNKIAFLDIEVDTRTGLPNVEIADKMITAIALTDRVTGTKYSFMLDEDHELNSYAAPGVTLFNCFTEEELLITFLDKWQEMDPTIVTGWNIDWFDIPYLFRRLIKILGSEACRLSPIGLVTFNDRRQRFQIAGISSLDYLSLYKKFTYTELPNYRLDTVARHEIKRGKYEFEGTLDDLRRNDIAGFCEYNMNDNDLVEGIDDKMKLIELAIGICTIGHIPYEDYDWNSRWLEGAIITHLHRKGIVAPNKSLTAQEEMHARQESGEKLFGGAYVKDPVRGRHEWVFSLDLQSLYPSVIMSLNISPETKIGKVTNWDVGRYVRREVDTYTVMDNVGKISEVDRDSFVRMMEEGNFSLSSNGILYRNDKVGIVPEILDQWFDERVEYKNKMKEAARNGDTAQQEYWDMRQHIQKIFLNSLYGVLGLPIFRFYDIDNALAVTSTSQDVIKTSAKYINNRYYEQTEWMNSSEQDGKWDHCIYIDTDSVYFSVVKWYKSEDWEWDDGNVVTDPEIAKQRTIEVARMMESELNTFYDKMAPHLFFISKGHRFVIKGETIASAAFWVTKKRYAMKAVYDMETQQDVDKVKVTGLDVVRSSFPAAFRKFMKEVLTDILDNVPKADLDKKILDYHAHIRELPVVDVARNTAVKNITKWKLDDQNLGQYKSGTPAHVKAAINHNLLLKIWDVHMMFAPITNGQKIKWVYVSNNQYQIESMGFIGDDTDAPLITKFVEEFIDYEKLFEKEFAGKLKDFYAALSWGNIPTEVNQRALKFFEF